MNKSEPAWISSRTSFFVLVTGAVAYHTQDFWNFLLVSAHFRPEYPLTVLLLITCPGWLFYRSRFAVGLTNAILYGAVAVTVALLIRNARWKSSAK
jgi:hypothetical protein